MANPNTQKGGQKAPAPLDRIDTPDGLDVEAVMAAARKVDREKALEVARKRRHMNDCAVHRGQECNCPCNLFNMPPPLESKTVGLTDWVRVDEAHFIKVKKPDPASPTNPPIIVDQLVLPRWICTTCGLAQRVEAPGQHLCDQSYMLWKQQPMPVSASITREQRDAGAYRLTVWRDSANVYHLNELVMVEGRVVSERERLADPDYTIIEAAMNDAIIEEYGS